MISSQILQENSPGLVHHILGSPHRAPPPGDLLGIGPCWLLHSIGAGGLGDVDRHDVDGLVSHLKNPGEQ